MMYKNSQIITIIIIIIKDICRVQNYNKIHQMC